jgi:hypothetical protein
MDTGQDMQATRAAGVEPTASLPRTAPRPQHHQGGWCRWWLLDVVGAMSVHTECALLCPSQDPTTPWTPVRTCRLPVPGGDSPPPACYGPHHALNTTREAAVSWLPRGPTLLPPCVPTPAVHCHAVPTTPPRHGHRAGYAGYPHQEEASHQQPATDRTTPSTTPRCWCRLM